MLEILLLGEVLSIFSLQRHMGVKVIMSVIIFKVKDMDQGDNVCAGMLLL